jgi:hypothetical protein
MCRRPRAVDLHLHVKAYGPPMTTTTSAFDVDAPPDGPPVLADVFGTAD